MAAADALIIRPGTVNVPLDYVVPNASEIEPLCVSATFADPSNAGPYIPVLEMITPDGSIIGPFPLATSIAAGVSARVSWFPGASDLESSEVRTLNIVANGGGSVLTTGVLGDVEVDQACQIVEWSLLADQVGSLQMDIWKAPYASFPPTVANTITAAAKPKLTAQNHNQSSTLTGWTTAINAGDILRFNIDSATTVTRATLSLKLRV